MTILCKRILLSEANPGKTTMILDMWTLVARTSTDAQRRRGMRRIASEPAGNGKGTELFIEREIE
jgi:hypothetical protein